MNLGNKIYAQTDISLFENRPMIGKKVPQVYKETLSNPQIIKAVSPEKEQSKEGYSKKYNDYYNQTEGNR